MYYGTPAVCPGVGTAEDDPSADRRVSVDLGSCFCGCVPKSMVTLKSVVDVAIAKTCTSVGSETRLVPESLSWHVCACEHCGCGCVSLCSMVGAEGGCMVLPVGTSGCWCGLCVCSHPSPQVVLGSVCWGVLSVQLSRPAPGQLAIEPGSHL